MKKRIMILASLLALVATPVFAAVNWGEDDLYQQLKATFNRTDGTALQVGKLNTTGVTAVTGNITATTGNIVSTAGSVSAATTVTGGTGVTATTGNVSATAGAVNAGTTMTAGTGITATTGNISATAGQVNAGSTMTAATGITATSGAITASNGAVSASTTVTGGTGVTATSGNVSAPSGRVTWASTLYGDGDTGLSSVLLSSSTSLGTSNMPYADIYKVMGTAAGETTLLHNGVGNGQISRFHLVNTGTSPGAWTLTPDLAANITSFTMAVSKTDLTLVFVNSTNIGWQVLGSQGTVGVNYVQPKNY